RSILRAKSKRPALQRRLSLRHLHPTLKGPPPQPIPARRRVDLLRSRSHKPRCSRLVFESHLSCGQRSKESCPDRDKRDRRCETTDCENSRASLPAFYNTRTSSSEAREA